MKTRQTDLMNETDFQSKKKIFNEIFTLQMNLAKYKVPEYQPEIEAVIQKIDELMLAMIESLVLFESECALITMHARFAFLRVLNPNNCSLL